MTATRTCRLTSVLRLVLANLSLLLVFALLSGCDGNYLVWSSDGKLGAVVGARGLRVCDGEGAISPVLWARAGMFRWIPQTHQGILVGYDYTSKWADIRPLLSSQQLKAINDETIKLKHKVFGYHGDPKKFGESALRTFSYPLEAAMQLHASGPVESDKMAERKWPGYSSIKIPVFYIKLAQVETQQMKFANTIDRGIDEIVELRVSPNGKWLACVKHEHAQEQSYILVLPLTAGAAVAGGAAAGSGNSSNSSGSYGAVSVAYNTNCYPDWSSDSRAIIYTRANNSSESDLLRGHGVHEGGLFRAEVVDGSGKLIAKPVSRRLASLVFDNHAPVRSLSDGRVLFASREIRLPSSVNATPQLTLFCLDGNKVDTVVRRNEDVAYFEASPDQTQLAVALGGGGLLVSKVNGADAVDLCDGKDTKLSGVLPQWKSNQELSYGIEQVASHGAKPNYSILVWNRNGGAKKDLSKFWGKDASSEIVIHRDFFQEAMTGVMEDMDRNTSSSK